MILHAGATIRSLTACALCGVTFNLSGLHADKTKDDKRHHTGYGMPG